MPDLCLNLMFVKNLMIKTLFTFKIHIFKFLYVAYKASIHCFSLYLETVVDVLLFGVILVPTRSCSWHTIVS